MRAQSGMEYMMIFGFSLIILAILWSFSTTNIENTQWDLQVAYAKAATRKIAEISDVTYLQGPPAQFYVNVNFPDNVQRIYINGTSLTLELHWREGINRNISADSVANLTGTLSTYPGNHRITVKSLGSFVEITES